LKLVDVSFQEKLVPPRAWVYFKSISFS
jgi:hypothetical protein